MPRHSFLPKSRFIYPAASLTFPLGCLIANWTNGSLTERPSSSYSTHPSSCIHRWQPTFQLFKPTIWRSPFTALMPLAMKPLPSDPRLQPLLSTSAAVTLYVAIITSLKHCNSLLLCKPLCPLVSSQDSSHSVLFKTVIIPMPQTLQIDSISLCAEASVVPVMTGPLRSAQWPTHHMSSPT